MHIIMVAGKFSDQKQKQNLEWPYVGCIISYQMEPLGEKIANEVSSTTRVIACRFQFPQWTPTAKFEMGPDSVWVYDDVKR